MAGRQSLRTGLNWLDGLLPEGFPVPSSTVITGPGGSGKPLIGFALVPAWLREGGSVVFMSLQYPDRSFIAAGLNAIAGFDVSGYAGRTATIELDTSLADMKQDAGNRFRANLVKPEIWLEAIRVAVAGVPDRGPGVMVLGSALNLLLFSPTYGRAVLDRMKRTLTDRSNVSYVFSVSTSAKGKAIAELETAAGNLIVTRSKQNPFRLFLRIERLRGARFLDDEIEVPFPSGALSDVKGVADHGRRRVIPEISRL